MLKNPYYFVLLNVRHILWEEFRKYWKVQENNITYNLTVHRSSLFRDRKACPCSIYFFFQTAHVEVYHSLSQHSIGVDAFSSEFTCRKEKLRFSLFKYFKQLSICVIDISCLNLVPFTEYLVTGA